MELRGWLAASRKGQIKSSGARTCGRSVVGQGKRRGCEVMQAGNYRPCVGIMLLNRDGLVFVGRRRKKNLLRQGMNGKCLKAESTSAKILCRRRCAS